MIPSEKSAGIENFLTQISGDSRIESIKSNRCIKPPIGCGKTFNPAEASAMDLREYRISGLCPKCQDEIFNTSESEENYEIR